MFRLASLFALACVTLAAASFLEAQKTYPETKSRDSEPNPELPNRWAVLNDGRIVPFHAQFSLN